MINKQILAVCISNHINSPINVSFVCCYRAHYFTNLFSAISITAAIVASANRTQI